ncbi:MAG: hypothetical protein GY854_03895 [Deltaproteobacteria bacterium]|nr:hypothetical protein [Deltaproteobacteria bacterium]
MRLIHIAIVLATALHVSCKSIPPVTRPVHSRVDSTLQDRFQAAITVHSGNLALVRETRRIHLKSGRQILRFIGVSDAVIPESVRVRAIGTDAQVVFEEQNFDADLLTPRRIAEAGIGDRARAYVVNQVTGDEKEIEGVLLSGQDGVLIQTDSGVTALPKGARIEMDDVPDTLVAQPVLSWITTCRDAGTFEVEVTYLTRGISWHADYVVDVDQKKHSARVQAWATIDNNTALALEDAELQLLAGDMNLLGNEVFEVMSRLIDDTEERMPSPSPPLPKEEALFEYHLYTVQRPLAIRARQKKQIALASAEGVPFKVSRFTRSSLTSKTLRSVPTVLRLEFEHVKGGPLGVPLPAGRVALWTEDARTGQRIQVGRVSLSHTPVGEPLLIELHSTQKKKVAIRARP